MKLRLLLVMRAIEQAAASGLPAPSNLQINEAMGHLNVERASHDVSALVASGQITAERKSGRRRFTVVATGQSTDWAMGPKASRRPRGDEIDPATVPPRIDRAACWRCGVNSDVGCRHDARAVAA